MPSPLTVYCPSCDAALKLKNREYIGKRVACPKCRKPFVVEDPAEAENDFSALDEFDSYEDDDADEEFEDEYERPAARRSAPPRPVKRGRSASSSRSPSRPGRSAGTSRRSSGRQPNNLPFIIGGAVVGVGALVGLAFLVAGMLGGSSSAPVESAWLPPDSEVFVSVEVAKLWNAKEVQNLLNLPEAQQAIAEAKSEFGMGPEESLGDIQRITAGGSGLDRTQARPGALNAREFIVVIQRKSPWNMQLIQSESRTATHSGKSYYIANGENVASYFPDERTRIVGPEAAVKSAIERGPAKPAFSQFTFVDAGHDMVFAMVPGDPSFFQQGQARQMPGASPSMQRATGAAQKLKGIALGLTLNGNLELQAQARLADGTAASDLDAAIDDAVGEARQALEQQKQQAPQMAMFLGPVEEILDSVSSSRRGEIVTVSARVPESMLGAQVPMMMALMLPAMQQAREAARRAEDRENVPAP